MTCEACLGYAAERAIGKEWLMVDEIVASNWEVGWILRGLGGREVSSHFHLSMFPASVDRPAHTITVHLADLTVPDDQPISTKLNQRRLYIVQSFIHFGPEQTQMRPPGDHSHEVGGRRVNHLHRWPLSPSQLGEESLTELPLELARTASERHRGRVSLSVGRSKGHLTIDEALLDKCSSHLESRCQSSCQTAWPTRCAALWRLLTGLVISVLPSCWSSRSLTVKLTTSTCQGVEMQAGGTPGGRWVGGRWVELHWWADPTKPQPQNRDAPRSRRGPVWGQMHNRTSGASVICWPTAARAKIFCRIFLVYLSSKPFAILQILYPVNLQRLLVWWYEVIAQKKLMWGRGSLGRTLIPTQCSGGRGEQY